MWGLNGVVQRYIPLKQRILLVNCFLYKYRLLYDLISWHKYHFIMLNAKQNHDKTLVFSLFDLETVYMEI